MFNFNKTILIFTHFLLLNISALKGMRFTKVEIQIKGFQQTIQKIREYRPRQDLLARK